jgi:hypothetical protein
MAATFQNAYAVVIGVGGDLPVTVADAEAIASIFRDPDRCAVPEANVQILTEWDATKAGIIGALEDVARKAKSNDVVTTYFSGHGAIKLADPGRRFLVPRDDDWLDGATFTGLLTNIQARRLLVLLDCCYAGGLNTGPPTKAPQAKSIPTPFDVNALRRGGDGTVVLSSSRANEPSWTGKPYSVFTQVVIDALCGAGAAQQDGYVRVTDLAMHVAQWVPAKTNNRQHPQLHLEDADNYPVAYYAAGNMHPLPKPAWLAQAWAATPVQVPEQPITATGALLQSINSGSQVNAISWDPDGCRIVIATNDAIASAEDILGYEPKEPLVINDTGRPVMYGLPWVLDVAFSPDGNRLATATSYQRMSVMSHTRDKGAVRIWNTADGQQLQEIGQYVAATTVAFSPDGNRLATGGEDNSARIWDVTTGQQIQELRHDGAVTTVAFGPDGNRPATGGEDNSARIWNVATGKQIQELPHNGAVTTVAFSPDGNRLATGSEDNSARIWDFSGL